MRVYPVSFFRLCLLGAALSATAAMTGCPAEPAKPMPSVVPAAPKPVVTADAAGAAVGEHAADLPTDRPAVSDEGCVGRAAVVPVETVVIGNKTYERKGSTISLTGADADDEFILGQLSDIKDHTPENAANLQQALAWFRTAKVDAIAITGDIGESAASVQAVLDDVAAVGVPVLAIIGNRETKQDFTQGMAAAQAKSKNIINMNQVRVFNTDDVSVVSLPGYYNRRYLHSADGCAYAKADVAGLAAFAASATAPNKVLISHGPPRQEGPNGIDRIHEGSNVGDPEVSSFLKTGVFPFGLFGNINEAGGRATDLSGTKRVAPESWADALYLNPGAIDSVTWPMLEGPASRGMAGLMKFKGKQASHQIFRVAAPVPVPASK